MRSRFLALGAFVFLLAACGGSGGGSGGGNGAGGSVGSGGGQPSSDDLVAVSASSAAVLVPSGSSTQFDIVITNPSTTTATAVTAALSLANGLAKGAVTCSAHGGAVCPANPATLTVPDLPAGGSVEFVVTVMVGSGMSGSVPSTVTVAAAGDRLTANNTASVVITTYSADVRVTSSSGSADYFSGAIATYVMTVSNAGPDTARNILLQDVVGPGQALSSITCAAAGSTCPAKPSAIMTVPSLASGGSLTFTVRASIAPAALGPIGNTLYVSVEGDPLSSNNVATSSATTRLPTSPQSPSFVALRSDAGDYIGQGRSYDYDRSNAVITVSATDASLAVDIKGDESWNAHFELPDSRSELTPGSYTNLTRYPFHDPAVGGLSWSGEARGCNTLTGSLTIDAVTYVAGSLANLDLRFEQHCEGGPALRGQIHWNAADATQPPGPVNPPPTGLWSPTPGSTPATGNYVYLQSDGLDFIGKGKTYTYTQANAVLTLTVDGNHLSATVEGNEWWTADFQGMNSISELQPGYYGNLQRYPFNNPATGGLQWSGEGRGCNQLSGWFVVDSLTLVAGALQSIDVRFEQHCENLTPALRGKIHWVAGDTTQPPGPQYPPPSNLWMPPPGATPASGNYVFLESEPGEFIGGGGTYTYTQADAIMLVSTVGARLDVNIVGDQYWTANFQGMNSLMQLVPGYYGNLERYPFHNPAAGGLQWSGEGHGCNKLAGWFVVDAIAFSGEALASIDLRFEQICLDLPPYLALHGKIHWSADDPTEPPGPQYPPPSNLWSPAPGTTPASGNYIYLESEAGDSAGQGETYVYTQANAVVYLGLSTATNLIAPIEMPVLSVTVYGDQSWSGNFEGMAGLEQLQPGYYGDVQGYPFNNPVTGGLSWNALGCGALTGWFVIDDLKLNGAAIESVDLRFEQHCNGGPALRGAMHWSADDPTQPPGPQNPPPPGLWTPPLGAIPAIGNYVYLRSDSGDYIGEGLAYTATPDDSTIALTETGGHLAVDVRGSDSWSGDFQVMNSISEFMPGYYGDLQRYPFHNVTKGGLAWSGGGRGCNELSGWFVVDNVTYAAGALASIDLRFEQHCENSQAALHGVIHWIQ